jgi:prepilin-type N-terminal cleavage/methylation domain-containing protein
MKINTPPIKRDTNHRGFTLIEMIGVLAVIAILAALLIPKVFSAIADAKINNAIVSAETVKTALADHYGKYGKFDTIFGTNTIFAPTFGYDTNLLTEALLDKPFQTKLGTNWSIVMATCASAATAATSPAAPTGTGGGDCAYSLDGTTVNNAVGQYVMEAVLEGVAEADAQAISQRLDGNNLSTQIGATDNLGRVKYTTAGGGATTVYIYLTHR